MSAQDCFTPQERDTLRQHGVVLFADRVIYNAQPPMPQADIDAVQAKCGGPLPPALLALWRQTAGGELDYELWLKMGDNEEAISWAELFWNGSNGYNDLQGWIHHELELAKEAAEDNGAEWQGTLAYLPIGGFEYLDRVYTVVDEGHPRQGAVLIWKKGLPPAWRHRLHEDSTAYLADDLYGAFAALHLSQDPLAPRGEDFAGRELLAYLDERREVHGLAAPLADKLIAFYRQAVRDWRAALNAGTLARDLGLAQIALRHAVDDDNAALVRQLAATGVDVSQPLNGTAQAIDLAVAQGRWSAAEALVEAGSAVPPDALTEAVDTPLPTAFTARLLAGGATPHAKAMAQCIACGASDSARLIGQAMAASGKDVNTELDAARSALVQSLGASLSQVRSGKLHHYLGADGLAQRIAALQAFVW